MNVKIDTKEKFIVITPNASDISANMTGELEELLLPYLDMPVPHVILNMQAVHMIDLPAAEKLAATQQQFYEKNCSFVICSLDSNLLQIFGEAELLDTMNITPTESEAWDIVQMEEIERELLRDFDEDENR